VPEPADAGLERLRRFSYWLDEGIRIPGTRWRIGLDPILGLLPGVGDAAGAILSIAIFAEAVRRRTTRLALLRMAANIAIDALAGTVPVLGDLFDAFWRANQRNLALLDRQTTYPPQADDAKRLPVWLVGGALLVVCGGLIGGGALLTFKVLQWVIASLS
jgi:hypothetical protein